MNNIFNEKNEEEQEDLKNKICKIGNPSNTWYIVINNYTENDITLLKSLEINKMFVSKEVGLVNKTPHLQGIITFKRPYKLTSLKKLHGLAHWEPRKSVHDDNYMRKVASEVIIDVTNGYI